MFFNYVKTAWRSLLKNKSLSIINIGGLAIGMASALMLLCFVAFQYSFDSHPIHQRDIYRVNLSLLDNDKIILQSAENYAALGPALKADFPEVLDYARLYNLGYKNNCVFTYNDKNFRETKFLYAEASFPRIFSLSFVNGDELALSKPNSAVISASLAHKIFGNENPVGKQIRMDDDDRNTDLGVITGVFNDIPSNSHIHFDILFSYETLLQRKGGIERFESNWDRKDVYTYVQLKPGANVEQFDSKLSAWVNKYVPKEKTGGQKNLLSLQPLADLHFSTNLSDEPEPTQNRRAISFLIIIAVFILTIAWVNYINMVTAGSSNRAKEIGVRKVLGSRRMGLIRQFLVESLTVNLIAAAIAIFILLIIKPFAENLFQINFSLDALTSSNAGWLFISFLVAGTLLSGLYPAFVLSSFKPIAVLKRQAKAQGGNLFLRKSLVVFQFTLSIFMVIGTIVVYQQVQYMLNQDLGMNTKQVMILERPGKWDTARRQHNVYVERFKEMLSRDPAVESVGMSDELPGKEIRYPGSYVLVGGANQEPETVSAISVDENFLNTLEFHFLAGRNFSKEIKSDQGALVITDATARLFGFADPQQAIGRQISSGGSTATIIGVVKDFHQLSLQRKAEPMIFNYNGGDAREFEYYLVKVKSAKSISVVTNAWNKSFANNPFSFSFLDEYFNRQYKNVEQFELLFGVFAFIAIFVACMGLFALLAFMIQQRVKEVGVRKVLGASLQDIVVLLSKDFLRLVLLANCFAWPIGWIVMRNWQNDFATRVPIHITVFIIAGLIG